MLLISSLFYNRYNFPRWERYQFSEEDISTRECESFIFSWWSHGGTKILLLFSEKNTLHQNTHWGYLYQHLAIFETPLIFPCNYAGISRFWEISHSISVFCDPLNSKSWVAVLHIIIFELIVKALIHLSKLIVIELIYCGGMHVPFAFEMTFISPFEIKFSRDHCITFSSQ